LKKSNNPRKKNFTVRLTQDEYAFLISFPAPNAATALKSGALLQFSAQMKNPQIAA
jgi:hypothetical protein